MTTYYNNKPPSDRVRVRRQAARGRYDRNLVYEVLDEALICHVGFVDGESPCVLPTIHARHHDVLYLHGAPASRMLAVVRSGAPVCVEATLVDGLVLARSALHHSMNYRSVVVFGEGSEVTDDAAKRHALDVLVERVMPGRSSDTRPPSPSEIRATRVVSVPLTEASVKLRTGPPLDEAEDYGLPFWAGVLPLSTVAREPVPDPRMAGSTDAPGYVRSYGVRSVTA
jgi:uncharacterized protein